MASRLSLEAKQHPRLVRIRENFEMRWFREKFASYDRDDSKTRWLIPRWFQDGRNPTHFPALFAWIQIGSPARGVGVQVDRLTDLGPTESQSIGVKLIWRQSLEHLINISCATQTCVLLTVNRQTSKLAFRLIPPSSTGTSARSHFSLSACSFYYRRMQKFWSMPSTHQAV